MENYDIKLVQAINNVNSKIASILEQLLSNLDEELFSNLQQLKRVNFTLENVFDEYALAKTSGDNFEFEDDILILIDVYQPDKFDGELDDSTSLKDLLLAKKEESKIVENRISRYALLIKEFAPTFVKDLECKLTCESSYTLTSINKALQMIANNRKNYIQ